MKITVLLFSAIFAYGDIGITKTKQSICAEFERLKSPGDPRIGLSESWSQTCNEVIAWMALGLEISFCIFLQKQT